MRILFDECVPRTLRKHVVGHACTTTTDAGFSGMKNGDLLSAAESEGFQVLLTVDRGIEHQQNPVGRKIAVVILRAKRNSLPRLLPLIPECLEVLKTIEPGQLVRIGST